MIRNSVDDNKPYKVLLAAPLLLALIPVLVTCIDIIFYDGAVSLSVFVNDALFSATGLRSLIAAILSGLLAVVLGLPAAFLFTSSSRYLRKFVSIVWLAGLCLPPVFLGGIWAHMLGLGPSPPRSDSASLARWTALSFSWALSFAPVVSLIAALSLSRIPRSEIFAGLIYLKWFRRVRTIYYPRMVGGLSIAGLVVGALAFTDASTPSHFGIQTSASLAAFQFLSTLETAPTGLVVLLPWLVTGATVSLITRNSLGGGRSDVRMPSHPIVTVIASFILLFTIVVPVLGLISVAQNSISISSFLANWTETANTLTYALIGGIATAVFACAGLCLKTFVPGHRLLLGGAALLLIAPGIVIGYTVLLGSIEIGGSQEVWWWAGFLLFRCAPWCLPFLIWSNSDSISKAALALGLSPRRRMWADFRNSAWRLAIAAMIVGAAGAMREVEYFAAFSIPAGESLAARSAQMLHFGMRPRLANSMLTQFALAIVWSFFAVYLFGRRRA